MTFPEKTHTIYVFKEYGQGQLGADPVQRDGKLYIRNWKKDARFLINGYPCTPPPIAVNGPYLTEYEFDLSENKNVHMGFNHVASGHSSFRLEIREKGVDVFFIDGQFGKFIPIVFRVDEQVEILNERDEPAEIGSLNGGRMTPIKIDRERSRLLHIDKGVYSLIRGRRPAPLLLLKAVAAARSSWRIWT